MTYTEPPTFAESLRTTADRADELADGVDRALRGEGPARFRELSTAVLLERRSMYRAQAARLRRLADQYEPVDPAPTGSWLKRLLAVRSVL